ncbi:MAG: SGNH/GDSL hydrolase family protein [Acetivibrionales bacterium]|jgi:lysophospholipase L1-like esterase
MISILCYGDSNTYGLNGETGKRFERSIRWTGVLQKLLGEEYYVIEEGLGGRTTVWDDPIEEYKNGKKYLLPCLESHKPIDMIVIMLGTNDLKLRFSVSACDIAQGMENLIRTILKSESGRESEPPRVLLMSPPPVGHLTGLAEILEGSEEKSRKLAAYYRDIAARYSLDFLDTGKIVVPCEADGVHLDEENHAKLAAAVAEVILKKFNDRKIQ